MYADFNLLKINLPIFVRSLGIRKLGRAKLRELMES